MWVGTLGITAGMQWAQLGSRCGSLPFSRNYVTCGRRRPETEDGMRMTSALWAKGV